MLCYPYEQKLELGLLVVLILLKIKFDCAQVSAPKTGTWILKMASINP